VDHPLPWLKYLDASDVENDAIDLDGLVVRSENGDKVGKVKGFIVDSYSARPYYVVVDAGGWFKSKHFLLPVGHAKLDADGDALVTDVPRGRVERFPGFDLDEFDKMAVAAFKRLNDQICEVCSITALSFSSTEPASAAWNRPDYAYPDWWREQPSSRQTAGQSASQYSAGSSIGPSPTARERERVVAREADPSPHFGGRAQPGDVIGVETEGEQTHIGETTEDENKRRSDAEKDTTRRTR